MDKPKYNWRIPDWFPGLGENTMENLKKFHSELLRFNKVINLISPKTAINCDEIHFADSISATHLVLNDNQSQNIYDIGTGNGFPGLVMAILASDRRFILLDGDMRKIEFIKHMVGFLNLKNVSARHARIEDLDHGSIDCAISRAFAPIQKAMEYTFEVINKDGHYYQLKNDNWPVEASQVSSQIGRYWKINLLGNYTLFSSKDTKSVIDLKRI